jgi:hypothetical protein
MSRCLTVGSVERQGYPLSLDHARGGQVAVRLHGRQPEGGADAVRAVQRAAWATLRKSEEGDG